MKSDISNNKNRALIVVPAWNEAECIQEVLKELSFYKPEWADIVVINDASTDNTEEVLKDLEISYITLPVNLGIGGAVQTGYRFAYEQGYGFASQYDSDGQHDPRELMKLYSPLIEDRADIIVGSRYIKDLGYKTPFARRSGMILFSTVSAFLIKKKIHDTTSGFRAINRKALSLWAYEYPADFPDSPALLQAAKHGLAIMEVPVKMRIRQGGTSSIGLFKSIYYPIKVLTSLLVFALREYGGRN